MSRQYDTEEIRSLLSDVELAIEDCRDYERTAEDALSDGKRPLDEVDDVKNALKSMVDTLYDHHESLSSAYREADDAHDTAFDSLEELSTRLGHAEELLTDLKDAAAPPTPVVVTVEYDGAVRRIEFEGTAELDHELVAEAFRPHELAPAGWNGHTVTGESGEFEADTERANAPDEQPDESTDDDLF